MNKKTVRKEAIEEIFSDYGPKTLMSGWNYSSDSYPRDRDDNEYDQTISSYKRIGSADLPTPSSTTRDALETTLMLKANFEKSNRNALKLMPYSHRKGFDEANQKENLALGQLEEMEHITTHQASYLNYIEGPMSRPPPKAQLYKVETKHRRLLTNPYDIKRPNLGAFWDDNLEYLADYCKSAAEPPPYGLSYEPRWSWETNKSTKQIPSTK